MKLRYAGAYYNLIKFKIIKGFLFVTRKQIFYAIILYCFIIKNIDVMIERFERFVGSLTAFAESDNRDILHFHRNFNAVNEIRAKISEIIQNLTITFDSGQPFNSKW